MSSDKIASRALAALGEVDPALAVMALWCRHLSTDAETFSKGDSIFYGPSFAQLGLAEQVAVASHHILHVALRHSHRLSDMEGRLGRAIDQETFGLAADAIVNETLLLAGHALPRPAIVLSELLADIDAPMASPISGLSEWDVERLTLFLLVDPQRQTRAREYAQQRGYVLDVFPKENTSDGDAPNDAAWQTHVVRAFEAGRRAGTGIGRLSGILADLRVPTVPWEVVLRGLLAKAVAEFAEPSYRRPSGRWVALSSEAERLGRDQPVFQPGRSRQSRRPRLVAAVDTSSSIDPNTYSLFVSEVQGIGRRVDAEIHLCFFDEDVHAHQELKVASGRWPTLADVRTGGGTSYGPVFDFASARDPSCLVFLTDLDAETGSAPSFPVIWAVTEKHRKEVSYGSVILVGG